MVSNDFSPLPHRVIASLLCLTLVIISLIMLVPSRTLFGQTNVAPVINAQECAYDASSQRLVIRGDYFAPELSLTLVSPVGIIAYTAVQVASSSTIYVEGVSEPAVNQGCTISITNRLSNMSASVTLSDVPTVYSIPVRRGSGSRSNVSRNLAQEQLSQSDVELILSQAVAQAEASGLKAAISVVDAEGRSLGLFVMTGAPATARIGLGTRCSPSSCASVPLQCGLEGACVPICAAALAKAVTGSFLSSQGHAFSTRTASFIVQEHFPPGVNFQPSGPLFGVQFSQLLCSDINPRSPLGLAAGAGGLPLYKNGIRVGGIGVEGDGRYAFDPLPSDQDVSAEELVALAGSRGFTAPPEITGDRIIVNGIRLPYANALMSSPVTVKPFNQLAGGLNTCLGLAPPTLISSLPSEFKIENLADAPAGRINMRLFPLGSTSFGSTSDLSRDDVIRLLSQAAKQALLTRAAIRVPLNSAAEVNIAVCDSDGQILGLYSTLDAPLFGLDVAAQKARTAAFFSNPAASNRLQLAGQGKYVESAARDGVRLDGGAAFSTRAIGFLSRPLFPDGIDRTAQGPFSLPQADFSPFNVGLQLDVLRESYLGNLLLFIATGNTVAGTDALSTPCGPAALVAVANGLQIFPGSVPLYKNGKLVGGIGVSGDGVDQDDFVATMASTGFEAPLEMRSDRFSVRGTRLPYVKFPRRPLRD